MDLKADTDMNRSIREINEEGKRDAEGYDLPVFENQKTLELDIEKIRKHFQRVKEILIKDYVILRYYDCQPSLKDFLNSLEKELIRYALLFSSGVQKQAADLLKVKQTCLFEKIKRFELKPEKRFPIENQKEILTELGLFFMMIQGSKL